MRRHEEQRCQHPQGPARLATAIERLEKGKRAREREEEEQAVHPAVDAVEEEQPAGRDDPGRDQRDRRSGEASAEERDERQARDGEEDGREAQASEPQPEMGHGPPDEEVERGTAPVACHVLHDARQGVPTDEQRERLVLVGRPGHQLVEEEEARREREPADPEPEPPAGSERADGRPRRRDRGGVRACLDPLRHRVSATLGARLAARCRSTSTVARTGTRSRCFSG